MTVDLLRDSSLPAAVDAERTLLGAVLLDNAALQDILGTLRPDDLSLDSHRRIVRAMKHLQDAENAVDIVTLSNELSRTHEIETVGGVAYLASLTEGLPRRPAINEYIHIVKNKSLLRGLMLACSNTIQRAQAQEDSGLDLASDLGGLVEKLAEPSAAADKAPVASFIVDVMEDMNADYRDRTSPCIPSGIPWFDAKTGGGYRQGKITLVCARPNVGKTPWAVQGVAHNCILGRKVVMLSLEMEKAEVLRNLIPYVVDLPNVVVNKPWMQTPEQNALANFAANALVEWNLKVYDGDMDIDEICWVIDRETRKDDDVLFALDHFGLIAGGEKAKDTRMRYNENSSRLRKKMKHKRAALIALCQLRKVAREFSDKPPVPDDIKESGNMYEDAFACLILHRPYEKETMKMSREVQMNLAKLRTGGSTGTTTGRFNTRKLSFEADAEIEYQDGDYFA